MTRARLAATAVIWLGVTLAACGPGGIPGYENPTGGNPLVLEEGALPYPSDYYLVDDATTATGRRVSMPQTIMPRSLEASVFDQDGFTVTPAILTRLPGGTDVDSLPSPTDHAESVSDDSSIWLVREDTWERVGILAELDQTTADPERQSIIIRPLRALDWDTGYVVIMRNTLRRLDGTPHEAGPVFRALRDGRRTNIDEIERQREDFRMVNRAIAESGLEPDEVVLAWSFHTRSEAATTDPLVRMQRAADAAPIRDHEITSDTLEGVNRQIEGTMEVPNFVDPDTRRVVLDAEGEPREFGTRQVPFVLTIPTTVQTGAAGGARPLIIYGHGFLGTRAQTTRGSFNDLCQDYQMSAAGTEFGFHEGIIGIVTSALGGQFDRMNEVAAEVQQSFVNSTFLAKLARERLASEIQHDPMDGGAPYRLIDPDAVHYMGISNGGTFGYVMAATSPAFERAVMVVGGGGLIHFLQRATQWNQFGAVFALIVRDPLEQQVAFSMVQQLLDPVDPMSYLGHLVHDRYPGLPPLRASMHMAVADSQVNNLVTEWAMRTADVPMVVPSPRAVWDLPVVSADLPGGAAADVQAVMHVYDEDVTPSPITNVPPAEDNGTHGSVRALMSYQAQVGRFLTEGVFVHVCDGPCDPE